MTTAFAIRTLIELAVSLLLIYGFMHEEKVIAFEQNIKRIIVGNTGDITALRSRKKQKNN